MTDIYGTLEIMKLPDGKWELLSSPIFLLNSGKTIKPIPGFVYDGGSVPQVFWSIGLTPVGTNADMAFLLHDWLYAQSRNGSEHFTRMEADNAMLEIMEFSGVPEHIAIGAWCVVRAASGEYWGKPGEPDIEDYSWFYDP